ncbi:unnamed protein product [Phytomonas sp. Hart1]|nr:unnamed protein product [Phytomonas sp. Hart1]|eukprot:CCW67911.1 unnamed protein product [Phytomonas sp. isolate Hart1]
MLQCFCRPLRGGSRWWKEGSPDFTRANLKRASLERKRLEASRYLPPVEPTTNQACSLYRQLLKKGKKDLVITDNEYFRRKVRFEFEVTSRQTSARVRGIMYEKGLWMLKNRLGGLM